MGNPDSSPQLFATPGTFQKISALEGRALGNAYTKRFIYAALAGSTLGEDRSEWSRTAYIRLHDRGSERYTFYSFNIDKEERVTGLRGYYQEPLSGPENPIDPPTLPQLLREIRIAERIQPKLRR